jgi:hypothetical protein
MTANDSSRGSDRRIAWFLSASGCGIVVATLTEFASDDSRHA